MAIKGITDAVQGKIRRIGKLHKGGEKVNGEMGQDLDHFRFTSDDPKIVEIFNEAFGPTPRLIQCYMAYPTPERTFESWSEIWNATSLVHRCDGEIMTRWLDGDHYVNGEKQCPGGHTKGDYKQDAVGRLEILIPELIMAGYVGPVTMETHGINDLVNISNVLQEVYDRRRDNPLGLQGIRFNLRRAQQKIGTPGFGDRKGQRSKATKWLVFLDVDPEWMQLQMQMQHSAQYNLAAPDAAPQLSAGSEQDDENVVDSVASESPENYVNPFDDEPQPKSTNPIITDPALLVTPEQAAEVKTNKGTAFSNLNTDQLKMFITPGKAATPLQHKAATILLNYYASQGGNQKALIGGAK